MSTTELTPTDAKNKLAEIVATAKAGGEVSLDDLESVEKAITKPTFIEKTFSPEEFFAYATEEIAKASKEPEAIAKQRLVELYRAVEVAKDIFGQSNSVTVRVMSEGQSDRTTPLASASSGPAASNISSNAMPGASSNQSAPMVRAPAVFKSLDEIDSAIADLKKKVDDDKSDKGEVSKGDGNAWPMDMNDPEAKLDWGRDTE